MRVSIIIPTFERPQLLKRAVDSIRRQSKQPHEIIIVNDSPWVPIQGMGPTRIMETTGGIGCGGARRLAMSRLDSQAEAVCYLDDDDELLPNHIELLSAGLGTGIEYAFSKALFVHADNHETTDPEPSNKGPKRYYDPSALLEQNIAPMSSFMHTRRAHDEIGGWDSSVVRLEDWDFWGRMSIKYGPPKFVNVITNKIYKNTPANMTTSNAFTYSLACSWRDIVSDRLKYLATHKRAFFEPGEAKKFAPPRIGVVMPVFNAEKYLDEAISSLLRQTYEDFEIIAVDDGSTDGSLEILNRHARIDRRIRVFRLPSNVGVAKALNHGLLLSRSEYVARMDADDVSMPTRFARQVDYLDHHKNIGVVGTFFLSMDEKLENTMWNNDDIPIRPEDVRAELRRRCCIGHPTVMMRRKVVEVVGGYSEEEGHKHVEDYELWLRVSEKFNMANIPEPLLKYRQYNGQMSSVNSGNQRANHEKLCDRQRGHGRLP